MYQNPFTERLLVIAEKPIIPDRWKLEMTEDKAKQFRVLKELLSSSEFAYAVNACDAGREGQSIFDRVYELSGSHMRVKRLWISSKKNCWFRQFWRRTPERTRSQGWRKSFLK